MRLCSCVCPNGQPSTCLTTMKLFLSVFYLIHSICIGESSNLPKHNSFSPVVSTCSDNNDKGFAPKSVREAGCTEDKGCEWSGATGNGECYEVAACEDYNAFKTTAQGRKKLCLGSTRFNCIYIQNTCQPPFPTQSPTTPEPTARYVQTFSQPK